MWLSLWLRACVHEVTRWSPAWAGQTPVPGPHTGSLVGHTWEWEAVIPWEGFFPSDCKAGAGCGGSGVSSQV